MSIFIGQPIYSLKDIYLGGDTIEKPVIFEGQEDVLLKGGLGKQNQKAQPLQFRDCPPSVCPF